MRSPYGTINLSFLTTPRNSLSAYLRVLLNTVLMCINEVSSGTNVGVMPCYYAVSFVFNWKSIINSVFQNSIFKEYINKLLMNLHLFKVCRSRNIQLRMIGRQSWLIVVMSHVGDVMPCLRPIVWQSGARKGYVTSTTPRRLVKVRMLLVVGL